MRTTYDCNLLCLSDIDFLLILYAKYKLIELATLAIVFFLSGVIVVIVLIVVFSYFVVL